MNYDVVCNFCMKQGCGGAAKIARLQFRPLRKMVNQTAYKNTGFPKSCCAVENIFNNGCFRDAIFRCQYENKSVITITISLY